MCAKNSVDSFHDERNDERDMNAPSAKTRKTLSVEPALHLRVRALAKRKGMLLNRLVDALIEAGIKQANSMPAECDPFIK